MLNSISSVTNWSWVALWRFWFFCCWVRVLFRGGRRGAELCVGVAAEAVGDGVVDGFMFSFACILRQRLWSCGENPCPR